MSKKASAFQVYSEDQVHQRQSRSYRNPQGDSYKSPPRSGRNHSTEWRDDSNIDSHQGRRSTSPVGRSYDNRTYKDYNDYDNQRLENNSYSRDPRYDENVRRNSSSDHTQARYCADEQFDRSWEREELDRRDNYSVTNRERAGSRHQDDYLSVEPPRDTAVKVARVSAQYSDSDEECLHESLRRKKQSSQQFSDNEDQRRWSTDDDYDDYRQTRKRILSDDNYHSPSPPPAKVWRDEQQYSSENDRPNTRNYPDYPVNSDKGRMVAPAPSLKKKKVKASKKNTKGKNKKQKVASLQNPAVGGSSKIQSLMDVQIPTSVKKQIEESSSTTALPRFGESRNEFRFSQGNEDSGRRGTSRDERPHSKYEDSNRNRSRQEDDDRFLDRPRDQALRRRDSDSNRKANPSHRDGYSGRQRTPDYDRRTYHHSDDEFDRQRRTNFSRDGRNGTDVLSGSKRKRQGSTERRDWQRGGNRNSQKDRSPDFRANSDSDQDSDREGRRRSWRDERRDRQPKKKDEEKDKNHRGDKKSKAKQAESKDAKKTPVPAPKKEKRSDEDARMKILPCEAGMAVLLTHPQDICIRGRAKVRVVAGAISVMGHVMTPQGSKTHDLFSPTTSSLLTITTCSAEKDKKALRKAARALGLDEKVTKDFPTGAVIFLATKLDYPAADFICAHPPFTQIFRYCFDKAPNPQTAPPPDPNKVGAAFLTSDQAMSSFLKVSDDFEDALKKWNSAVKESKLAPIAVLCGGVNCGKSTFSRYMVNSALNSFPKVCYLDCDVGQTEFSPPGTVALTVVDKPMFGPPFCHQRTAESMCFYGLVSPGDGPTRYIQCLQQVFQAYHQMEPAPPLIVNTMGWNEGIGLKLFVDILHLITPDLVIQLNLASNVLNFPAITPEYPALEAGWVYNTEPVVGDADDAGSKRKKHQLVAVKSLVTSRFDHTRVKLTPKNMRDLALLSHLMQGFPTTVTLTSAVPYMVPWNRFAVHVCHSVVPRRLVVDTLNASVVALCRADLSEAVRISEDLPLFFEETPICQCLGYGLVRAIDHKKQTLFVVTPMSPDRLAQVNTLLRGSVNIPDQLFLKQSHMEDVPYIDALEPAMALAPVRPRSRMPRRN
ncbi:polynucleotide 5'-hydroxyl-kinase NOL9-like [Littorina saxatilis]|uniref:polynucleotide 5'-hydroxyl-kinase NOL9-like n=1 Tax=Littorina saxatilis TaxID=31220 RepID=UPI0038B52A4C